MASGQRQKIIFPAEVLPVVAVLSNTANFLLSLPIYVVFWVVFKTEGVTLHALELPIVIVIQFVFTLGLGLFLAALTVHYRDVRDLLANRTTLLAGISHDLRTPLTRMQLELALLPPETPREQVQSLDAEIDTMNRLVGQTLELARGLGKHEAPDMALSELLASLQSAYEREGVSVGFRVAPVCDQRVPSAPLRRILDNLIGNALRHGDNKPVEVNATCSESAAVVTVVDQGPGIPPAMREQVFTPFFRLEDSRNPATGGSGLGLAIVRQLCDFYGWHIDLADAPGGGLRVRLEIASPGVQAAETT